MSDMDPDGMDSELEGEGDLSAPENITQSASQQEQQAKRVSPPASEDKAGTIRSRRVDETEEGENGDVEHEEETETRSTARSASKPPYGRRESDRNRPVPPGDRRR
jgi:hypothetical protein